MNNDTEETFEDHDTIVADTQQRSNNTTKIFLALVAICLLITAIALAVYIPHRKADMSDKSPLTTTSIVIPYH